MGKRTGDTSIETGQFKKVTALLHERSDLPLDQEDRVRVSSRAQAIGTEAARRALAAMPDVASQSSEPDIPQTEHPEQEFRPNPAA